MKLAILFATAVIALAAVYLLFWGPQRESTHAMELSGTVEANEIDIVSEVVRRVVELKVDEGDVVKSGQLLAHLDSAESQHALERAEARIQIAEADLNDLKSLPRKEDVRLQQGRVAEAEQQVSRARTNFSRAQQLRASGTVPQAELDEKSATLQFAELQVETARRTLEATQAGARPGQIQSAEARLAELKQDGAIAALEVQHCDLTAPTNGVVLTRSFAQGEMLPAGSALVTLIDLSSLWVDLSADERSFGRIQLGQRAMVRAEAFPDTAIAGAVSFVADRHDFTPRNVQSREERARLSYRVKVKLEAPPAWLKPGMFVEVSFAENKERR